MAWTDTGRKNENMAEGVASVGVVLNSTVAGNLIALASSLWGGAGVTSATVSDGTSYTQAFFRASNLVSTALHYRANGGGGNITVTCTSSDAGGGIYVAVHEFSGGDTTSPASGTAVTGGDSGTTTGDTGNMTPADNNVLLLAMVATDANGTITENAGSQGFTLSNESESGPGQTGSFVFKIISGAPGTPNHSWTFGAARDWAAGIAAFKPALVLSPTYLGSASAPADGVSAAQAGPGPVAVTPPGSMVAGDLVVVFTQYRGSGVTFSVGTTGGQTWNTLAQIQDGANVCAGGGFWCRFNGTWAANPTFGNGAGTNALTVVMHVFRPFAGTSSWALDGSQVELDFTTATNTPVLSAYTTTAAKGVVIGRTLVPDDCTFSAPSGSGWNALGTAQYRNTTGTDQAIAFAYQLTASVVTTSALTMTMATLGPEAGTTGMVAFAEVSAATPLMAKGRQTFRGIFAGVSGRVN